MTTALPSTSDALAFVDAIDRIVAKSIADGTPVEELTIGEKKWIFRLALGGAELLITFRLQPQGDVAVVEEGEQATTSCRVRYFGEEDALAAWMLDNAVTHFWHAGGKSAA